MSFEELWDVCAQWSFATFGSKEERDHMGPINHLQKEVAELLEHPHDPEEWADCFMLICDGWRRRGGSINELMIAVEKKLEICKLRKWGTPDKDGVFQHIKQ